MIWVLGRQVSSVAGRARSLENGDAPARLSGRGKAGAKGLARCNKFTAPSFASV